MTYEELLAANVALQTEVDHLKETVCDLERTIRLLQGGSE